VSASVWSTRCHLSASAANAAASHLAWRDKVQLVALLFQLLFFLFFLLYGFSLSGLGGLLKGSYFYLWLLLWLLKGSYFYLLLWLWLLKGSYFYLLLFWLLKGSYFCLLLLLWLLLPQEGRPADGLAPGNDGKHRPFVTHCNMQCFESRNWWWISSVAGDWVNQRLNNMNIFIYIYIHSLS
jgi:hypothetical protein